jgi:hypothetical protein
VGLVTDPVTLNGHRDSAADSQDRYPNKEFPQIVALKNPQKHEHATKDGVCADKLRKH